MLFDMVEESIGLSLQQIYKLTHAKHHHPELLHHMSIIASYPPSLIDVQCLPTRNLPSQF
jgi:hypothetical protein